MPFEETAATDHSTTTAVAITTVVATTTTTTQPLVSRTDNNGLLYRVESAPWFGGFELHILSRGIQYGFADTPGGAETASELLLRIVLWTFASQHSQFVAPNAGGYTIAGGDDQVDIDGYVAYLEANDWVDEEVYVPDAVGVGNDFTLYPEGNAGVEKSPALQLDFKQPFIIGNDDLTTLDGSDVGDPNVLFTCRGCRTFVGVTAKGQFYFSLHKLILDGDFKGMSQPLNIDPKNSLPITTRLGEVLVATSRITYPEPSPYEQWKGPSQYYNNPFMVEPEPLFPPYPVLNIYELIGGYDEATKTWINNLFAPTTSP